MESLRRYCDTVILIDMQVDFVSNIRKGAAEPLLESQVKVLRQCASEDIPCVVLELSGFGPTVDSLIQELRSVPRTAVIIKKFDNGFSNTELDEVLRQWGGTRLLLMGVNAEYCVFETALAARRRGYAIVTSPRLISGQEGHNPDDGIFWYSANGTLIAV